MQQVADWLVVGDLIGSGAATAIRRPGTKGVGTLENQAVEPGSIAADLITAFGGPASALPQKQTVFEVH